MRSGIEHFYSTQNIRFKLFTLILTIIISLDLEFNRFLILYAVLFHFFLADLRILLSWLKALNLILPLFSSLLVFSILFKLELSDQIYTMVRISFYLLLSVFITRTIDHDQLLILARNNKNRKIFYQLVYFILATLEISRQLSLKFKICRNKQKNISPCVYQSISSTFNDLNSVNTTINNRIDETENKFRTNKLANFTLILIILIEVLLYTELI